MPTKSLFSNSSTSVQYRMDANKVSLQQQLNQCSMQNGCQQSLFLATAQPVFSVEWMPTKSLCSNSSTSFQCRMDANKVSLQQQLSQCSMQNGCQQSLFLATAQPVFCVEWMPTKSLCSNSSTSVQCRMDANKVSLQQQLNQCSMQNGCQQSLFVATAQPVFNVEWMPTKSLCSNSSTSIQCRMDANKVSLQQQLNQCSMQNGCQQSLFIATAQPVFNIEWMPTKSLCSNSSTSVHCRMDANKVSLQQQLNQCSIQNGCQQSLFVATAQPVFNVEWMPTKSLCSNSSTSVQCRMDANKVSLQQQLNQCSIQNGCQQSLFIATAQPVFNVEWMLTKSLCRELNQCLMQNGCQQSLFVATAQPVFNAEWMPTKSLCSNSSTSVQCRMDANKVSLQQQLNQCSMQNGCQQSLFVATAQPVFSVEWMPTKSLCSNSSISVQCRMEANKVSLQQQLNQCLMQNGCQQSLFVATAQPVFNVEWMPTKSLCSNSSTSVQCRMVPTKSLCSNSSTSVQCRMDANKVSLQQQLNQCSLQNGCQQSLFVATAQPVFNVEWMPTKSLCSNSSTSVQYRMDANKVSLQQQLNQCSMQNGCQQSLFVATAQPVFSVEWMLTKSLVATAQPVLNVEWMPTKSLCTNNSTSVQCGMDANKVSLYQQLNQCSMQNGCQQSLFVATAQPVFNVEWMPTKSLCINSSTSVQCRMDANKVSLQQQLNQCSMQNGANKVSLQQQLNLCSMQNGCQQSLFIATAQPVFNIEWCQQSLFVATAQPVFNVEWMPTKSLCSNSSTSVQCRMDANKVSLQQQLNQCSMQNGCQQSLFVATAQPVFNVEWMPTKSLCSNSSTSVQCRMVANKVSLQQQLNQSSMQNGCQQSLFVATAQPVFFVEWMPTKCLSSNSSTSVQCRMDANKVSLQQQLNQCSMQNGCQQSLFVATAQPVFNVEWMPTKSLYSNSSTSVQYRMDANKVSLQQQLNLNIELPTKSLCSNSSTSVQCRMDANKVSLQQQLNQCSMQNGCQQSLFVATAQPVFNVEWMPTKSLCSNSSTSVQCRMGCQCLMQRCQLFVATAQPVFNVEWMPTKSLCSNSSASVQCRMDANKVSLQQQLNQCSIQNGCQQRLFVATAQPVFNIEWMPSKALCSNSSTSVQCVVNGCQQSLFVATAQPVFNVEWMPTKSLCSNSSTSVQCRMDANKVSLQQQLNQCSIQNGCQQSLFVATAQPVFNVEWMPTKSLCSNSSTSVQCRMDANKVSLYQQLNQCSMWNGCQQGLFVPTTQPVFNVEWMPTQSLCSNSSTSIQCRMDAYKVSLQQQLNQCSVQNGCQQSLFVATAQPVFNVEWMPTKSLCSNSSTSVQCRMDANKVSFQQQLNQCSIQNGCHQRLFVATAQPVFNVEWMPTKSLSSNSSTSVQCRMVPTKSLCSNSSTSV